MFMGWYHLWGWDTLHANGSESYLLMFQMNNTVIPKVVKSVQYLDFWVHFYEESSQVFWKVKCYVLFCRTQG